MIGVMPHSGKTADLRGPGRAGPTAVVAVEEAVYVEWDLAGGTFRVGRWPPGRAETVRERRYP